MKIDSCYMYDYCLPIDERIDDDSEFMAALIDNTDNSESVVPEQCCLFGRDNE